MSGTGPLLIPAAARHSLRVMFIAKHAKWEGGLHGEDGNHAVYHAEMRETLRGLGLNLVVEDRYEVLFDRPDVDFVFPLLNRGGFLNSEMLLPLLCTKHGIPYLGASPIVRGLADDKHLSKMTAVARGVPTLPWAIYRRGAPIDQDQCPAGDRLVIKPNASSASWGVGDAYDWTAARTQIARIQAEGHDAIVEPFLNGDDVEVCVITINGEPVILPLMLNQQTDPTLLRTYNEKRDLVDRGDKYRLIPFVDPHWQSLVTDMTKEMIKEFQPFDYGRFEFRLDQETGQLHFMEVNLSCNLWSQKTISRAAGLAGFSHTELIETILCEAFRRCGLIELDAARAA